MLRRNIPAKPYDHLIIEAKQNKSPKSIDFLEISVDAFPKPKEEEAFDVYKALSPEERKLFRMMAKNEDAEAAQD